MELHAHRQDGVDAAGYESQLWIGVFGPKALPVGLVSAMHAAVNESISTQDTIKRLEEQGIIVEKMTVPQFAKYMESEQEKWAKVIRQANIKGE